MGSIQGHFVLCEGLRENYTKGGRNLGQVYQLWTTCRSKPIECRLSLRIFVSVNKEVDRRGGKRVESEGVEEDKG